MHRNSSGSRVEGYCRLRRRCFLEALEIARANAARLQLAGRVRLQQSNVLDALARISDFDFVVSNPPYVGFGEADKVQRSVRDFEPQVAVFAGERGLNVIEPLIEQAHRALKANGWLAMEIGYSMRDTVVNLLCHTMWEEVRVVPDLQGIPQWWPPESRRPHLSRGHEIVCINPASSAARRGSSLATICS